MNLQRIARIMTLAVIPSVNGLVLVGIGLSVGVPPLVGLPVACIAIAFFAAAGWMDLSRTFGSNRKVATRTIADLLTRETSAFILPFTLVVLSFCLTAPFGLVMPVLNLLLPYAGGLLLGRAAIEQHYASRPDLGPDQRQESVYYHHNNSSDEG